MNWSSSEKRHSQLRTETPAGNGSAIEVPLLREELRGRLPYQSPRPEALVWLNANERPLPPSAELIEEVTRELQQVLFNLNRYPDPEATALRVALADYLYKTTGVRLDSAKVWVGNGSNEVLQQVMQAFGGPGRVTVGFEPTYSMYSAIAVGTCTGWLAAPRRDDFTLDVRAAATFVRDHAPDIVIVARPNNPAGGTLPLSELSELLDAAPGLVVVDEAYGEFSERPSAVRLLPDYEHKLIVTRTMSKAFGFAGARIGYLAAGGQVIDGLRLVGLPYHLSSLSQAVARVALRHVDDILGSLALLRAERDRVTTGLSALGYRVVPTDANYVLFSGFTGTNEALAAWRAFLEHGVLIRDLAVAGYLRVTIGTPGENDAFLQAAREIPLAMRAVQLDQRI